MKKKIVLILMALLLAAPSARAETLYEFFGGRLPSLAERAEIYGQTFGPGYRGTAEQNALLLAAFKAADALPADFAASERRLGGSVSLPTTLALFETTLASAITSTASSLTLTAATDKDGNLLASSTYGFIIDEGTASEEMVLADCTSTSCSNLTRGVSALTGTTSVSALKHSHRRGASVKITDGPFLVQLSQIIRGRQGIETLLQYDSRVLVTGASATTTVVTKYYVDNLISSGCADASTVVRGCVEIATGQETASSTPLGGTGSVLSIPASQATSSWNGASNAALHVPVLDNNGNLNENFIGTSTANRYNFGGAIAFNASTTFSGQATTTLNATTSIAASSATPLYIAGRKEVFVTTGAVATSSVWQEDGSGNQYLEPLDMQTVAYANVNSATSSVTVTVPAREYYEVTVDFSSRTADTMALRFNNDSGTTYGAHSSINGGGFTADAAGGTSMPIGNAATTTSGMLIARIDNASTTLTKLVDFKSTLRETGAQFPSEVIGSGSWNNTSAQIVSITILDQSANNFNNGLIMRVRASRK